MNKWTHFWDMHSGGGRKLKWEEIYVEAPKEEACRIFHEFLGRNPENVTCDCCGDDYSITEYESLEEATKYQRRDVSVEEYIKRPDVKILTRAELPANFLQHLKELELL